MKPRPYSPLFREYEPDIYVVDTSAWSNIDIRSDADDVWRIVVDLIQQGRIIACAAVLNEMQDEDFYMPRIFPYEAALKAGDRSDIDYLMHVGKITLEHPAMAGARGIKNKADPYVIALAELEGHVVVADETCNKRRNKKIPGVCEQRGVKCKLLDDFLAEVRKARSD